MSSLSPTDDPSALSDAHRARIKAELVPGERLLWSSVGKVSTNEGCGPVTLSVLALIFLAASTYLFIDFFRLTGPRSEKQSESVAIFAVVTGSLGLFMVFGTVSEVLARKKRRKPFFPICIYVLTPRRAIVWRPVGDTSAEVISLLPNQVLNISRVEHCDGTCDLRFWMDKGNANIWDRPAFIGIDNARQVEEMARRVLLPEFLGLVSHDAVGPETKSDWSQGPESRSGEL